MRCFSIEQPRCAFGAAERGNHVAIRVQDLDADGGGIAIRIRGEQDISGDLDRSSKGAVGVEREKLKGRRVASPSHVLPRSKARTARTRRLIVSAGQCAALIKHLEGLQSSDDDAVTIRQREVGVEHAYQSPPALGGCRSGQECAGEQRY